MGRWGEEAEGRFPVLARPFGQILSLVALRHAGGSNMEQLFPGRLQRPLKTGRRHLATLDRLEQFILQPRHPLRQMLPVQTRGLLPAPS
jgi:hypothetical protein